jgi:GalNAc-alpha-(1->4)-GalNAc-alpha-(1->3)-diNAcBac-PP-undecaprenol alpha-1,4-N-acetyl-D-galactosaminyltransferase
MRITCIIHSLDGGGAERVMAALASSLVGRNHKVTLITLDDGKRDRYDVAAEVQRLTLDLMYCRRGVISGVTGNARRVARLRKAISASRPEVVLSFCDRTNVLTLLAAFGLSVPVVVSEHSNPEKQQMPWPWSWLRPKLYPRAAAVIVLTRAVAETVAPWSTQPPIVIPVAPQTLPDVGAADMPTQRGSDDQRIVGVGRLEVEKGFDQLIQAFATVADQHRQWKLIIYGEGSLRSQLEQQRDRLGLSGRVQFPGWTRPIWPALQSSDLFVLPSRYEGFPVALLEAMAVGLPCVAFDCPDGPSVIIRDRYDGLLVPSGDISALAAAMNQCMGNPELRATLGQRAVAVTQRFSWQAMVDAYERVLLSQS